MIARQLMIFFLSQIDWMKDAANYNRQKNYSPSFKKNENLFHCRTEGIVIVLFKFLCKKKTARKKTFCQRELLTAKLRDVSSVISCR